MDGGDFDAGFAQQGVGIAASGAPERIEDDAQAGFLDDGEVDDFAQAGEIHSARVEGLRGRRFAAG